MEYPSNNPPPYSSGVPQQQYQPVQVYMTNPPPPPGPTVVAVEVVPLGGRCGRCQLGIVREHFTLCGWLWAIFFFPIGLICLFTMRLNSCSRCGAIYD
ncbi:brain protein I3 [Daphnia magna]|uniref:Uncharacterized protein n=2 Tax=Daphnia magna TaxID=35525 RepID=A0ABR0B3Y8_9CRUS|nr:brain protein I3 [Daphnia magna]KAK4036360.1 hypothetical protein OUZ56_028419 [Daphnia magna]KZS15982.1 putative Brain protein I3 [Daphnia magna]